MVEQVAAPVRRRLTPPAIVAAAIAAIDSAGLETLSMRRLADDLGVTPMALYKHFPNKDALLGEVLATLLAEVDIPGDAGDWRARAGAVARSFRDVLLAHPKVVPLMHQHTGLSPETLRPVEFSLSLLRGVGMSDREALMAHWALVGYVLGHVSWQLSNPLGEEHADEVMAAVEGGALPRDEFPALVACLGCVPDADWDAAFDYGLQAILRGLGPARDQ